MTRKKEKDPKKSKQKNDIAPGGIEPETAGI